MTPETQTITAADVGSTDVIHVTPITGADPARFYLGAMTHLCAKIGNTARRAAWPIEHHLVYTEGATARLVMPNPDPTDTENPTESILWNSLPADVFGHDWEYGDAA